MDLSPFSPTALKNKVAVLIDADNVPAGSLPQIEARAAALGQPMLRLLYGDMTRTEWSTVKDYRCIHCTTTQGRNRADMQLVVDAMDVATRGLATSFLIVSDDRDFDPLIAWLRAMGFAVDRMGKVKATEQTAPKTAEPAPKPVVKAKRTPLDQRLAKVIAQHGNGTDGLPMNRIGALMKGETVRAQTGCATWRAYFRTRPDLYHLVGAGSGLRVLTLP